MKLSTFVQFVLALQCTMLALIALDAVGVHIPILRQLTSAVYLTLVPGLLILKIGRLNFKTASRLLFAAGLSILTLMGVGLSLNFLLPAIGISKPLSLLYLVISTTAVTLFLLVLCYFREEQIPTPTNISRYIESLKNPSVLLLLLLPFVSIIGAYFVNDYNSNALLLLLVLLIAAIPLLVVFDRIPKGLYGLAIFITALSLLYHWSLISAGLRGTDVFEEYYWASQILNHGLWNFALAADYNAVLSVVLIPPVYSIYGNVDLIWVFKIIIPFLYAGVPLGMFIAFQKQMGEKMAFLSSCLFIFANLFFTMNWARQSLGEFFIILLIILIVSGEIDARKRSALFVAFSVGLVVSHYASAYLFLILIALSLFILTARQSGIQGRRAGWFRPKIGKPGSESAYGNAGRMLRLSLIVLFAILALGWYMYVSSSTSITDLASIYAVASRNIGNFLNPDVTEGLGVSLAGTSSILYTLEKDLYFVSLFFVAVGAISAIIWFLFHRPYFKLPKLDAGSNMLNDEYLSLAIAAFILLLVSIVIPYASSYIGVLRLYGFMLLFLSPFFLYGIIISLKPIYAAIRSLRNKGTYGGALKLVSFFLVIFLLANSGFLLEITKDPNPSSLALSSNQEYRQAFTYSAADGFGALFFANHTAPNSYVATDSGGREFLRGYIFAGTYHQYLDKLADNTTMLKNGTYVYLTESNLRGEMYLWYATNLQAANPQLSNATVERPYHQMTLQSAPFYDSLLHRNRIYDDGSQIFE